MKKRNNNILLYSRLSNAKENFLFVMSIIEIFGLILLISFGWISIIKESEMIISIIIGIVIFLLILWRLMKVIRLIYLFIFRYFYPIMIIQNSNIKILGNSTRYMTYSFDNVRSIKGKFYSSVKTFVLTRESPRVIFFSEILISMKNGEDVFVELINTSLKTKGKRESLLELKSRSGIIGKFLAKELGVDYFWENKMIDIA